MKESLGSVDCALDDSLSGNASYHTCLLLCMGLDQSNGVMSLDANHQTTVDWPYQDSLPLYQAVLEAGKQFKQRVQGELFTPLPNWDWPFHKNVTVHSLGGCVLADDPARGVTSSEFKNFGEVFGYHGLYVADGAIVPTAVGANPTATISALSEIVAEGITGAKPNANL